MHRCNFSTFVVALLFWSILRAFWAQLLKFLLGPTEPCAILRALCFKPWNIYLSTIWWTEEYKDLIAYIHRKFVLQFFWISSLSLKGCSLFHFQMCRPCPSCSCSSSNPKPILSWEKCSLIVLQLEMWATWWHSTSYSPSSPCCPQGAGAWRDICSRMLVGCTPGAWTKNGIYREQNNFLLL